MVQGCCWRLALRGNHYSYSHFKIAICIIITSCVLMYTCFTLGQIVFQPSLELYPMIQFDRGGFTKDEILHSSQHALEALSKLSRDEAGVNESEDIPFMKYLLDIEDRKTRRQLLALEALGMSSESDFKIVSSLGYHTPLESNDTFSQSLEYFRYHTQDIVEYRNPDYSKLCFNSTYTLSDSHHTVDQSFCTRLKKLGLAIEEGRESPLLTMFTWWLDPINDGEILSRKAMMANWNIFRPFLTPVIFTNSRMNMAFANGHGWPCYPVTKTNDDRLPLFEPLFRLVSQKFVSSFYGYAKPIAMFDPSLLETLMAIKDRCRRNSRNKTNLDYNIPSATQENQKDQSLLIYGNSIKMPHTSPDYFVNCRRLYKYLRGNNLYGKDLSVRKTSYIFYTGVDFTNMPPLVVHDNFLFQFLIDFSFGHGHSIIDASKTLLAMQTFRPNNTNEWGRRYLYCQPPDLLYNKKLARTWYGKSKQHPRITQQPKRPYLMSYFDSNNRLCVFDSSEAAMTL